MGPTASGKTALAEQLAQAHDCELVSVDSALVYRGLDIGAAKPDYPHHLVDIRDPSESYSAADFVQDAHRVVADICARGRVPLLVGGTMLYFRAFLEGLAAMPPGDPAARAAIEELATRKGWPHVHGLLSEVDPAAAARIHPNHSQRLARALEVYRVSGVPLSEWHATDKGAAAREQYEIRQLAIAPADRAVLHRRIAERFDAMLAAGLVAEVATLYDRGDLHPALPAVRAVGYRQLWQHLAGECSLEEAVERAVAATRQLAKRQFTWLRKWNDLAWIYGDNAGNVVETVGIGTNQPVPGRSPYVYARHHLFGQPL
ncbi:MAG: tRNA (adenosine(37)-N6)-dimethylallyltransferase MiaA [Halioglobus sp.]|nr:tRNA (adenosine(37)-N6)-dimethylallyltransferase MiaA [Halioglobus sp.]